MGDENSESEVNSLADLVPKVARRIETSRESVREACKKIAELYQYNHNSLRRKYQRSLENRDRAHKNMKFSDEDEEIICALILSFSSRGSALTRGILIELVKETFELDDEWSGEGWIRRFLDRHSDLITMTMGKSLDPKRVSKVTEEHVDKFIASFEYLQEHNIYQSDYIINVDESSCKLQNNRTAKVITSASASKQGVVTTPPSQLRTIIPFVAASGKVWMVVYVFKPMSNKSKKTKDTIVLRPMKIRTRGEWMSYYASTSEGYITNDLWIDIIAKFIDEISPVKGDLPAVLLLDRVGPHMQDSTITKLADIHTTTLYLPAHSSHILQPLDDVPFANLKRIGCQARDKLTLGRQIRGESLDNVTQEAILIAEKRAFTTPIIKAGFARTGVWPWNEKLIRENFAAEQGWEQKNELTTDKKKRVEEVATKMKDLFATPEKPPSARGTVFKKLGMCMTGDEVRVTHEEIQKSAELKKAAKQEKANSKGNKRTREESNDEEMPARKKGKVAHESDGEMSFEISEEGDAMCDCCFEIRANTWTCPQCQDFNLCTKCQKATKLLANHRLECEK
jgi:hypothetical protein